MKKLLISLFVVVCLVLIPNVKAADDLPEVTDHEKVTVYLFRGNGCHVCQSFLTEFSTMYQDYADYFEIVAYESWNNSENQELMLNAKEYFGEDADSSVPFIVIGDSYHSLGYNANTVIEEALKAYQNESYTDLIAQMIEEEGYNAEAETFEEACADEGIMASDVNTVQSGGISDGAIVAIIFVVIIVGFGSLVLFSRQQKNN